MYIICIESSNSRGMGHLFRSILYLEYLDSQKEEYVLLINDDEKSLNVLNDRGISYTKVDFSDVLTDWESKIINEYNVNVWINDKFETAYEMGLHISKNEHVTFCVIDDIGAGAQFADMHFAGMIYPTLKKVPGKKTFCGNDYIILNAEIDQFVWRRKKLNKMIVSMGGSDPHGVTVQIVQALGKYSYDVDVVIGPNFKFRRELQTINTKNYPIMQNVPSLVETFSKYDLAITGGGVTPCEANAAGLPCIIIANAPHEINTGKYIQEIGSSIFAGNHDDWDKNIFENLELLDIKKMSDIGINNFDTRAIKRIFEQVKVNRKD